ncbi:50S ribosomal protein L20 [Paracholeplasma brassicae]|jgi:large subunit ribosomal protein L20|uniref:Large ribosomal subunit protein bL20 n=2 Tax=Acholeplasma brassicae TaxID=61635 RepID=U4KNN7_9MOLU|nr:50S ribosomal protein L20 [Paracholeplasma sp.]CCV65891.1 50S ribosomal protein L20 [Paracholeplasma brassicae]
MPRVKNGKVTRARRKKILKLAKGYFGSKRTLFRTANEQVMRSLNYAYRDRKQKKRNFRKLWISRINAAAKLNNYKYSLLISGLAKAGLEINRKMLADLAVTDMDAFKALIEVAKKGNAGEMKAAAKVETKKAPAKKVEKEVTREEVQADLEALTVAQLKEIASQLELTGVSALKKADLIEAILDAQAK